MRTIFPLWAMVCERDQVELRGRSMDVPSERID